MEAFDAYATYYDICNQDKEYDREVLFIDRLLKLKGVNSGDKLLELGAGTGIHAFLFAEHGYSVDGIDLSPSMVEIANAKVDEKKRNKLRFEVGDARTYRSLSSYSAIVSLFHVASYQSTNSDLSAMIETAAFHLKSGGVFIFDCWYGPGVLTDLPSVRVKTLDNQDFRVIRIAEPSINPSLNLVDVNYKIWVTEKKTKITTEIEELHKMRYLFYTELAQLFEGAGFSLGEPIDCRTGAPAGLKSWTATFVAIKK